MKGLFQQLDPKYIKHFPNTPEDRRKREQQVKEILSDDSILIPLLKLAYQLENNGS